MIVSISFIGNSRIGKCLQSMCSRGKHELDDAEVGTSCVAADVDVEECLENGNLRVNEKTLQFEISEEG